MIKIILLVNLILSIIIALLLPETIVKRLKKINLDEYEKITRNNFGDMINIRKKEINYRGMHLTPVHPAYSV